MALPPHDRQPSLSIRLARTRRPRAAGAWRVRVAAGLRRARQSFGVRPRVGGPRGSSCVARMSPRLPQPGKETDSAVRIDLAGTLGHVLAETRHSEAATALLEADECTDAIRFDVARRTRDADRRRVAIAAIRDEACWSRSRLSPNMRKRAWRRPSAYARRRACASSPTPPGTTIAAWLGLRGSGSMRSRSPDQAAEADAILAELEALATEPGPILTAVIELNRRWEALDVGDAPRVARSDLARQALQARFDREHEEQRSRARFERRLSEWLGSGPARHAGGARVMRASLARYAMRHRDTRIARRIRGWMTRTAHRAVDAELQARAHAETLVAEAEQLAGGTSIDDAKLPERWQTLDRAIRTPALTRRFEAALIVVEQRRLAQIRAAEQEANAVRQQIHSLLHTAERHSSPASSDCPRRR